MSKNKLFLHLSTDTIMKLLFFFISIAFLLSSCHTYKATHAKKRKINGEYEGTFQSIPQVVWRGGEDTTLLQCLSSPFSGIDSVSIKIENGERISLHFCDKNECYDDVLYGRMKNKKTFIITHKKERIYIPPVIPILFARIDHSKTEISITKNDKLLIHQYHKRGGALLWFMGDIHIFKHSNLFNHTSYIKQEQ